MYTNVIPNLLVKGVAKAIKENRGFKIYISNIMTEPGQTDNYTLSDHIKAIHEHTGKGIIDYCIYDTGEVIPEFVRRYNKEGKEVVEQDTQNVKDEGVKLIQRNLSYIDGEHIRHNPDAIASSIIELICEDMKFRDMQNDTQYLMLNSKLKDTKKKLKSNTELNNKVKNKKKNTYEKGKKRTSKFAEKYKDRIESIRESDEETLRKKQAKMSEKNRKKEVARNIKDLDDNKIIHTGARKSTSKSEIGKRSTKRVSANKAEELKQSKAVSNKSTEIKTEEGNRANDERLREMIEKLRRK